MTLQENPNDGSCLRHSSYLTGAPGVTGSVVEGDGESWDSFLLTLQQVEQSPGLDRPVSPRTLGGQLGK